MSTTINISITPSNSGNTEVLKNGVSLGLIKSLSTFIFNIDDTIKLISNPNSGYEFSHYVHPAGNQTTDPIYEDKITNNNEKNLSVVFDSKETVQKYDCVEGICEESSSGKYTTSNCDKKCDSSKEDSTLKDILLIAGIGVILWTLFREVPED